MSKSPARRIPVGDASVTIFNIGDIRLPLADYMSPPAGRTLDREELAELAGQLTVPIHAVHIQLPTTSVMVDAGAYDLVAGSEYAIDGYEPPVPLVEQMKAASLEPETVDHVVITHRHWDHFNGTTNDAGRLRQPCFPNARHYLSETDWQDLSTQLDDADSVESRTLGVLRERGLLDLVEGDRELVAGLSILAAPGETAGHQIVRLHSAGETLYCLGDLYHHPLEFGRPEWMVSWADRDTTLRSRAAISTPAVEECALLVSTHIREVGVLRSTEHGVQWFAASRE